MAAVVENLWNSRATGRDFLLLALGLAAGGVLAGLLLTRPAVSPTREALVDLPTGVSGFMTTPVGTYQIAVADNVLWRINTGTGEIQACGAGPSEDGQLTIVCSLLTEQAPSPNAGAAAPQPPARPRHRPASW